MQGSEQAGVLQGHGDVVGEGLHGQHVLSGQVVAGNTEGSPHLPPDLERRNDEWRCAEDLGDAVGDRLHRLGEKLREHSTAVGQKDGLTRFNDLAVDVYLGEGKCEVPVFQSDELLQLG